MYPRGEDGAPHDDAGKIEVKLEETESTEDTEEKGRKKLEKGKEKLKRNESQKEIHTGLGVAGVESASEASPDNLGLEEESKERKEENKEDKEEKKILPGTEVNLVADSVGARRYLKRNNQKKLEEIR